MQEKYTSDMVLRTLAVFVLIGESGITGLRPGQIATLLRLRPDQVTRCITNLVEAGLVEAHDGAYRPTPKITKIALAVMRDVHIVESRIVETKQRYLN